MTRAEILIWLNRIKWLLLDMGFTAAACQYEDAELRLPGDGFGAAGCHQYAAYLLPPGRRGRARLALRAPEEARALAVLAGLVRAWGTAA